MSSFKYGVVTPTILTEQRTDIPTPNDNISIPYGLVRTIEHYLGITGILELLDTFKTRGIPMGKIATAMCVHSLTGNNSMSNCSSWLEDPNVLKELGICGRMSQRTLNRGLEIVGEHTEEIICRLWKGINENFDLTDTDVNIDGSAVTVYGPKAELGDLGYARDKNPGKRQIEFAVAELQTARIPFYMRAFKGNTADQVQYRAVLPDIFEMIRDGSWVVMDNGGAAADILDTIVDRGHRYLTRVKMNTTDDAHIASREDLEYVESGVCCFRHRFRSSGRTTYLFFSSDLFIKNSYSAERKVDDMIEAVRNLDSKEKIRFRHGQEESVHRCGCEDICAIQDRIRGPCRDRTHDIGGDGTEMRIFQTRIVTRIDSIGGIEEVSQESDRRASDIIAETCDGHQTHEGLEDLVRQRGADAGAALGSGHRDGKVRHEGEGRDQAHRRRMHGDKVQAFCGIYRPFPESFDTYEDNGRQASRKDHHQQLGTHFQGDNRQYPR